MSDRVKRSTDTCDCGLPFALLTDIEGRAEDALDGTTISVHPNVLHRVMEPLPVGEWQVVQERERLRVLVVDPGSDVLLENVRRELEASLRSAGVAPPQIMLELASTSARTTMITAPSHQWSAHRLRHMRKCSATLARNWMSRRKRRSTQRPGANTARPTISPGGGDYTLRSRVLAGTPPRRDVAFRYERATQARTD